MLIVRIGAEDSNFELGRNEPRLVFPSFRP